MSSIDLENLSIYDNLTRDLRNFNEKICVVEINIKLCNESDEIQVKTRKIQSKIYFIQQRFGVLTKNTNIFGTTTHENAQACQICISWYRYCTSLLNDMSQKLANPTTLNTSTRPQSLESSRNYVSFARLLEKCKIAQTVMLSSIQTVWLNTVRSVLGNCVKWKTLWSLGFPQNPTADTKLLSTLTLNLIQHIP